MKNTLKSRLGPVVPPLRGGTPGTTWTVKGTARESLGTTRDYSQQLQRSHLGTTGEPLGTTQYRNSVTQTRWFPHFGNHLKHPKKATK